MGAGHSGSVLVQFGSAGQPVPKLFDVSIAGTNVRGRGCLRYTGQISQSPTQTPATPTPTAPNTPAATAPAPEKIISPKEAKELFRSVDELMKFASDDTGLPIKHDVKRKLADRHEVESYLEKGMKDDKDAKRLERSSEVLKKFGLLPRDFQLGPFLVSMLKEQVAGYYDPKKKTVNILNWIDPEQQKPVLAHELTHALQDQSFGMEKWMEEAQTEGDKKNDPTPSDIDTDEESSAREAVVEGQAMVVMLRLFARGDGENAGRHAAGWRRDQAGNAGRSGFARRSARRRFF